MWYCIVDMKQIKFFILHNIYEFTGEGQLVWLVFEQGIIGNAHFMIEHIFGKIFQSGRLAVGDKMYLMSFGSERETEFSGYYTTTSKGGVANDSNFHKQGKGI